MRFPGLKCLAIPERALDSSVQPSTEWTASSAAARAKITRPCRDLRRRGRLSTVSVASLCCSLLTALLAVAVATTSAAAAETTCDPIPGAAALLRPGTIFLLGELHGTAQAPRAVAALACEALAAGRHVVVGLELPQSDQEAVDRFMAGDGDDDALRRLTSGEFWQREYQDGRASVAMLDLHARLRALAVAGSRLDTVYVDDPSPPGSRDRAMAERVLALHARAADAVLIVLTGNLHNRLTRGTPFDADLEPMGFLIAEQAPAADVVSLELTYGPGSAWICQGGQASDCGVVELGGRSSGEEGIVMVRDAAESPVSGSWHLGSISASAPARLER